MSVEDIGLEKNNSIVLGKHSGRHAFNDKLKELGYELSEDELNKAFERFKILADKKKDIFDEDIIAIINDEMINDNKMYELISLQLNDCSNGLASAAASVKFEDEILTDAAIGEGTIDAVFKVIDRITGYSGELISYKVDSVTEGKDALAKVTVKVIFDESKPAILGHGLNIDTMTASARAYLNALNSFLVSKDLLTNCKVSYKDKI
jgi:2-isopropylmalate synthase